MYEAGQGVARDEAQAVNWYRAAAQRGSPEGQFNLGRMYENGRGGLAQDGAKAVFWYRKAAEQGFSPAQNNVGSMYFDGRGGLAQDYVQAAFWYRKAAEQGFPIAHANLGALYAHGQGVERDDAQAVLWYPKAAQQGDAQAQKTLAGMQQRTAPSQVIAAQYNSNIGEYTRLVLDSKDAVTLRCVNQDDTDIVTLAESISGAVIVNKLLPDFPETVINGRVTVDADGTSMRETVRFEPDKVIIHFLKSGGAKSHSAINRRGPLWMQVQGIIFGGIPIRGQFDCTRVSNEKQF